MDEGLLALVMGPTAQKLLTDFALEVFLAEDTALCTIYTEFVAGGTLYVMFCLFVFLHWSLLC